MLFIFSKPVLIRHLWQLKTAVFLHWCLICAVLLQYSFLTPLAIVVCITSTTILRRRIKAPSLRRLCSKRHNTLTTDIFYYRHLCHYTHISQVPKGAILRPQKQTLFSISHRPGIEQQLYCSYAMFINNLLKRIFLNNLH